MQLSSKEQSTLLLELRDAIEQRGDALVEIPARLSSEIAKLRAEYVALEKRVTEIEKGWFGPDFDTPGVPERLRTLKGRVQVFEEALRQITEVNLVAEKKRSIDWKAVGTALATLIVGAAIAVQQYCSIGG